MKYRNTLFLNSTTIKKIVDIEDALFAIERAFKLFGQKKAVMPAKLYLYLDKYKGDFRAMPAYLCGIGCGIKWVNVHPQNKRKNLPTVMAIMILSDPKNGFPLCVMDATYSTTLRTGAAGGVAAKYLANASSEKVALVGCGVQARTQLEALRSIFEIKEVSIWSIRRYESEKFAGKVKGLKKCVCDTIKECVKDADIVVTTTPSRKPIVKLNWLKKGVHINAIGADANGKQELEPAILKKGKVVIDAWEQASHSGEINVALKERKISKKDIYADIGQIVSKKKRARTNKDEITVFDSTGLAIQDVAIADLIYKRAKKLKKGKYLKFI